MTINLIHGPASVCRVINNALAKKLVAFIAVLLLSTGISQAVTPAPSAPANIEMMAPASGETIIIHLDHAIGNGASLNVALTSEYTTNFPGCGISAVINGTGDKIVVYLPDSGCTPSGIVPVECAVITAQNAAGEVAAEFIVLADGGLWEVVDTGL